jgi:hypothetical protein
MDLLALLGLSYVVRRLRRRERNHIPTLAPNADLAAVPTRLTAAPPAERQQSALLWRGTRGLLLVTLLVLLALLPWPTAWETSAAFAPAVHPWRLWAIANIDVLTLSLVVYAMVEPLLWRLLRASRRIPRLLGLIAQLVVVRLVVGYWRYRNWRLGAVWASCRSG